MMTPPIPHRWTGDSFEPLPGFRKLADRAFVVGQVYRLAEENERSKVSHNHEFAWLKEAHANLPEGLAEQYPTPEHLRKRALIRAGWFTERVIDAGTKAAAERVAAYCKGEDEFAHVVTRGPFVAVRKARSQSKRAMGAADFQASKTALIEIIADMLGVTAEQLAKAEAA